MSDERTKARVERWADALEGSFRLVHGGGFGERRDWLKIARALAERAEQEWQQEGEEFWKPLRDTEKARADALQEDVDELNRALLVEAEGVIAMRDERDQALAKLNALRLTTIEAAAALDTQGASAALAILTGDVEVAEGLGEVARLRAQVGRMRAAAEGMRGVLRPLHDYNDFGQKRQEEMRLAMRSWDECVRADAPARREGGQ